MTATTKPEESAEIRTDSPKRKGRPPKPPMPYDGPMFGLSDTEVTDVPLAHLDVEDTTFQCRVTLKPELLVDSVKNHGIQVPLVVRKHPRKKDKFQIVCGFRRATAAQQIGYVRVPCVIRDLKDEEAHILSYAENECRKTLGDLDRANGIAKLRATKKTTAQVAAVPAQRAPVQRLEGLRVPR